MRVPPFYITKSRVSSPSSPTRRFHSPTSDITSDSLSSAPNSPLPQCSPASSLRAQSDRLAKSRATGQSYRDNEREHIFRLITAIEHGRLENNLLFVLYANPSAPLSCATCISSRHAAQWHVPWDVAEDGCEIKDVRLHALSARTQAMLGQGFISGALATVLLELMLHRRNMLGEPCPVQLGAAVADADRRRRRRPPYRTATTQEGAASIVQLAVRQFCRESSRPRAMWDHVQWRLGHVAVAAYHMDNIEAMLNPQVRLSDCARHSRRGAELECSDAARGVESELFDALGMGRRGDGAKRCSRCGVLKITGSGHGRSKCADGLGICSAVPFPASPAMEDMVADEDARAYDAAEL
ncbi:hypothetical protein BWQ96_01976 [Gracilariopsis chorda]|uniref:Uncharacterized protein n=1 Tax=Gracilariopsis chorda TaxID=448386 RepID=A0A2V3J2R7_9FLOR|nr:hypothetical protein BWQ96_01976 [Gracilariopsis chorda]|eukprot:PXF48287.1 hypothetical protein BWQ96_01976 [Gracilariopsis chorda]